VLLFPHGGFTMDVSSSPSSSPASSMVSSRRSAWPWIAALVLALAPAQAWALTLDFEASVDASFSAFPDPEFWEAGLPAPGEVGQLSFEFDPDALGSSPFCGGGSCEYDWVASAFVYQATASFPSGTWSTTADFEPVPPFLSKGWVRYTDGAAVDRLEIFAAGSDVELMVFDLTAPGLGSDQRFGGEGIFANFASRGWAGSFSVSDNASSVEGSMAGTVSSAIPEPAGVAQMALGLLLLAAARRRF